MKLECAIRTGIRETVDKTVNKYITLDYIYSKEKVIAAKKAIEKELKAENILEFTSRGSSDSGVLKYNPGKLNSYVEKTYTEIENAKSKLVSEKQSLLENIYNDNPEYQIISQDDFKNMYMQNEKVSTYSKSKILNDIKDSFGIYEQYFPSLPKELFNILSKYKADSLGVIHPEGRSATAIYYLEQEIKENFGDRYEVRQGKNNTYYVSDKYSYNNIVKEEAVKSIKKATSTSISDKSGVPSSLVKAANRLANLFNSNIKIISTDQAKQVFPGLREGTVGFYDPKSGISYIIYERMKETTLLHEAFSHPFILYIKQNYNGLYQTLLQKAKDNTEVKSYVDTYYSEYNPDAKDMEYIAYAIDLENKNQLKDKSLIKSILRFWERLLAYIKEVLNLKQDINKLTTFKDVVKFATTTKERVNLSNTELLNIPIMESFTNLEGIEVDDFIEPNLEDRSIIDTIKEQITPMINDFHKAIEDTKSAINSGEYTLENGEKQQLDTITARINALSRDLYNSNITNQALIKDKNLGYTIQYLSNIIKGTIGKDVSADKTQEILKTLSNISRIMEEALVLTRYTKEKISEIQNSDEDIVYKQRFIYQYYQIMQALESSLQGLYNFYIKTEKKSDLLNPVVNIVNAIFSDIKNIKDINSKYVVDYWADRIVSVIGEEENEIIDAEINKLKNKISKLVKQRDSADSEKRKTELDSDITKVNLEIEKNKKARVTKENIKAIINGDYGDSNFLYYKFMAAFNSPDLVIAGVDMTIEKYFMNTNDETLIAANQINALKDEFMAATGQTKADQTNIEKFSKPLIRKVEFKKVVTKETHVNNVDPETQEVTEEQIYTQELVDAEEDVILDKFKITELHAKLNEYKYKINQARQKGETLELQKLILEYDEFREKYFITPVTEEFLRRTSNSNLITEEDLTGLTDEKGNPLSLETNPEIALLAKEKLYPLYEQQDAFYTLALSKIPTSTEIEDYAENERKIKELGSLFVFGTTKLKTGIDMAIAKAINRTKELKRGVFKYTLHESAKAKYRDRYVRHKQQIQDFINAGSITVEEGKVMLDNWHKLHSNLITNQDYFDLRNKLKAEIDGVYEALNNDEKFSFLDKFKQDEKEKTKKKTLEAFWENIYDKINPFKDLEGIIDGTLAQDDLQKKIKDDIEAIEITQRDTTSLTGLTNANDFKYYLNLVNGFEVSDGKNTIPIDKYNFILEEGETTLASKIWKLDFSPTGLKVLQSLLLKITTSATRDFDDKELSEEEVEKIRFYLFKTSTYAKKFALIKKIELSKDSSKTNEERASELKEQLKKEFDRIINPKEKFQVPASDDYKAIFLKLSAAEEMITDLFKQLSSMSERLTTPYYDYTVKNMKQKIYNDNFNEILDIIKKDIDFDSLDEEEKKDWEERFEDLKMTSVDSLKGMYRSANSFIDNKLKETDWYKNNHYKKIKLGRGTVDFPTPLWTFSKPVDDKFITIEPNNTYKTRSINEFLLDENKQPTNIRLKNTDTKIKARPGDTLEIISNFYNVPVEDLRNMNPTLIGEINEGEEVIIKKFGHRAFKNLQPREYLKDGSLSEYVDPQYRELEKSNPALVKVIDKLNNIYYKYQNKSGVKGLNLLQSLARMEVHGWEAVMDDKGITSKKILKKIKNLVTITPQDRDRGYGKADFADKKVENIPVKFLADIPYELRSRDVFGVVMQFIAHANEISSLNEIYPITKELHKVLDENSPAVKEGQRIKMKKLFGIEKGIPIRERSGNTRAEHVLHLLLSKILNQKRRTLNIGNWNVTKTLDNLAAITSFTTLGGLISPSIVVNYMAGKVQTLIEVWSKGVINRDDYNKGIKRLYKYFYTDFNSDFYKLGEKSLQGQLITRYNPSIKSVLELYGQELKKTPVKDYLSFDIFFKTRRLSEFELSTSTLFAYLEKYQVMDGNNLIPLAEAYELDKEGNIKLKDNLKKLNGEDFTKEDEDRIRIKTAQLNMIIQGNYSSHHKPQIDTTVFGPLVTYFRKHISAYLEKAFSTRHYNYALGGYVEGYQRKLWITALQLAKAVKRNSKEDWKSAVEEMKANYKDDPTLKKGLIHNGILTMIYILLAIVDSEDDDDNKKTHSYDSFFAKAMIYQLMRLKSDLELISGAPFIAGLNESLNIIKSPSIVVDKTIVNLIKLMSHTVDYAEYKLGIIPEKDVVLSRDYYGFDKGQLKLLRDIGNLTGVTGATFNPDEMVKNLKNVNSALFK